MMDDRSDWERLARLRRKYGKQKFPEIKEYTKEETEQYLLNQQEKDRIAKKVSKEKDERLSRKRSMY